MKFIKLTDVDRGIVRVNPVNIQMYYRSEEATRTRVVLTDVSKSFYATETPEEIDKLLEEAE